MTDAPNQAPSSQGEDQAESLRQAAIHKMTQAWYAVLISVGATIVFTVIGQVSNRQSAELDLFRDLAVVIFELLIYLGLGYGTLKRNREAAIALFLYFIAAKIFMWMEIGQPKGIIVAVIFAVFYFRGVLGAFQYQRLTARGSEAGPVIAALRGVAASVFVYVVLVFGSYFISKDVQNDVHASMQQGVTLGYCELALAKAREQQEVPSSFDIPLECARLEADKGRLERVAQYSNGDSAYLGCLIAAKIVLDEKTRHPASDLPSDREIQILARNYCY